MTSDAQDQGMPMTLDDVRKGVWVLGHRGDISPVLDALGPLVPGAATVMSVSDPSCSSLRLDYASIQGEPNFASIDLGGVDPTDDGLRPWNGLRSALRPIAIMRAKDLTWWRSSKPAWRFAQLASRSGGVFVLPEQDPTMQATTIEQVCDRFEWSVEEAPIYLSSAPALDSRNDASREALRRDLQRSMLLALRRRPPLLDEEYAEFGFWCQGGLQWKVLTDIWLRSAWELQARVGIPKKLVRRDLDADLQSTWNQVLRATHCAIRGCRDEPRYLMTAHFRTLYESAYQDVAFGVVQCAKGSGDERVAVHLALFTVALGLGYASLLREDDPLPEGERFLARLAAYLRQASTSLATMAHERSLSNMANNPFIRQSAHRLERSKKVFWRYFDPMLDVPELMTKPLDNEPLAVLPEFRRTTIAFTPEDLSRALQGVLPVRGGSFSVELGSDVCVAGPGALRATLQVVRNRNLDAGQAERDVCEQEVAFVAERHLGQPARVRAFVEGWARALRDVLPHLQDKEFLMPTDFVDADALDLLRAKTAEDFRRALLAKVRLGRLMR